MSKWCGKIGFGVTEEVTPGVWEDIISERVYYGDITRSNRRLVAQPDSNIDSITITNELSIVADPYAHENFLSIRYVTFLGKKWKVSSVEMAFPRLLLSLGGEYNA